jgi:mannitol 2-dehydrogenase
VTQNAVIGLARLSDPALADWIKANVAFPNGMVDRITPATGPREREMAASFGLGDDPVP